MRGLAKMLTKLRMMKAFPVMSPGPLYHGFLTEDLNKSKISHMYLGYLPSLQAYISDAIDSIS